MEYKTITIIHNVEFGATSYENPMEELDKYLKEGFTISSISTNHSIRQNGTYSDRDVNATRVDLITTYLLAKE